MDMYIIILVCVLAIPTNITIGCCSFTFWIVTLTATQLVSFPVDEGTVSSRRVIHMYLCVFVYWGGGGGGGGHTFVRSSLLISEMCEPLK